MLEVQDEKERKEGVREGDLDVGGEGEDVGAEGEAVGVKGEEE